SNRSWKSFMLSSLSSTIRTVLAIRVSFAWQAAMRSGASRRTLRNASLLPIARFPTSTRFWGRTPATARKVPSPRDVRPLMQTSGDFLRKRKQMAIRKRDPLDREAAESLAVQALTDLAEGPERLGRFLALSGLGPDEIRIAAGEPGFLAGVLEYLSSEEPLLLD